MNKRIVTILLGLIAVFMIGCNRVATVSQINIVPQPVFSVQKQHSFTLSKSTRIYFENLGQNSPLTKMVLKSLRKMHFRPSIVGAPTPNCISFRVNDTVNPELGDEGYIVDITSDRVLVSANSETGLYYGFVSFAQMLPDDVEDVVYSRVVLPECTILDYPRYPWRGCMVDVSSHFFSVLEMKRVLNVMSLYKMNKFHWHLTDNHGWRIEIKSHPELCEVGAWRPDRSNMMWRDILPPQPNEPSTYGGYYSQDDIRSIVELANSLQIEIIPEISLPSHCGALLAAAPHLSCTGKPAMVQTGPCDSRSHVLCAGNDSVLSYIYDILDEVVALFPGKYVHIGGYEFDHDNWKHCPLCQNRMKQEKLHSYDHLNDWFQVQIVEYLASKGKIAVGMNTNSLLSSSDAYVVMSRESQADAMQVLRIGFPVVVATDEYCAFDSYQDDSMYQPMAGNRMLPISHVYSYDPFPVSVSDKFSSLALGGQCNLWTEHATDGSQLEYMLLPRMCAFSEALWSPKDAKNWMNFRTRIEHHKRGLVADGYKVCAGAFKPKVHVDRSPNKPSDRIVSIENEVANTYLFYTLDGTEPTQSSHVYLAPLTIPKGTVIKTLSVYGGMERNRVYEFKIH